MFNMGFFSNKKKRTGRVKKQVYVNPEFYLRVKAKMALEGNKTFSWWVEQQMKKELGEHA